MSKHNHHSCSCDHTDVKYCNTCKIIHCLDCNQEWSPRISYYPYTYTQPWYTTLGQGLGAYSNTAGASPIGNNLSQITQATQNVGSSEVVCNHQD